MATTFWKLLITGPAIVLFGLVEPAHAQIATDGSVGPRVELDGPEFDIRADLGRQADGNLFHSFQRFSLAAGERATFSGPDQIRNVISRVTGGERSDIDGTLRSTIPGADFYFINPAGILFGPNASLDLQGSFHVSTADELRFRDGANFSADLAARSSFSVARPEAFGFLGGAPAAIQVGQSVLEVPVGKSFSLVGGDITIDGDDQGTASEGSQGVVRAEGGWITLAAAAGPAEIKLTDSRHTVGELGDVALVDQAQVDVSGDGRGKVVIRAGQLAIESGASVFAFNNGTVDAVGGIDVQAKAIRLSNGSLQTASQDDGDAGKVVVVANSLVLDSESSIASVTEAGGDAGLVRVEADSLILRGSSFIQSDAFGEEPPNDMFIDGNAAPVHIVTNDVKIVEGSSISSDTFGDGDGGTVTLISKDVVMRDGFITSESSTSGDGGGGSITIETQNIESRGFSLISTGTRSIGDSGMLTINATNINLGESSIINSGTAGSGAAGDLVVNVEHLRMRGGQISGTTFGGGRGGDILLDADRIVIDGRFAPDATGIFSGTEGNGDGGTLTVRAHGIDLRAAEISTSTFGSGNAGRVVVLADDITLRDVSDISSDTESTGNAGGVTVTATNLIIRGIKTVDVFSESLISSGTSNEGDAGSVEVKASNLEIALGSIDSSALAVLTEDGEVLLPSGHAGMVRVTADNLVLQPSGFIGGSTSGAGDAGGVIIETKTLVIAGGRVASQADPDSTGDAGSVTLRADELRVLSNGEISSGSFGRGSAGAVTVVGDRVLLERGQITTSSASAGGGELKLIAKQVIDLHESAITTSVEGGEDPTAGNITIDSNVLVIDSSQIQAKAPEGFGGRVRINADNLVVQGGDFDALLESKDIDATGGTPERAGTIAVDAAELNLAGDLVVLQAPLLDAASQLRAPCGARQDVGASSFTAAGRGGLPAGPNAPLGSSYGGGQASSAPVAGGPVLQLAGCAGVGDASPG